MLRRHKKKEKKTHHKQKKMDWLQKAEDVLSNVTQDAEESIEKGGKDRKRVSKEMYGAISRALGFIELARDKLGKRKRDSSSDDDDDGDDSDEVSDEEELTATKIGLTMYRNLPFKYTDGISYATAMTAFQAQKAPLNERSAFSNLLAPAAAKLGRSKTIDSSKWDAQRFTLMTNILYEQALQTKNFRDIILTYADADYVEDSAPVDRNLWWQQNISSIWKDVKARLEADMAASADSD